MPTPEVVRRSGPTHLQDRGALERVVALCARHRLCHDGLHDRAEHLLLQVVRGPHLIESKT